MGKKKLRALRALAQKSIKTTQEVKKGRKKKRKTGQTKALQTVSFSELKLEPPKSKPKFKNSTWIKDLFDQALFKLYGDGFRTPYWGAKERSLAMRLIKQYVEELCEKAVAHFVASWPDYIANSRGKLRGMPNISLLWGMQSQVFGDIQGSAINCKGESKLTKNLKSDEYSDNNDSEAGW